MIVLPLNGNIAEPVGVIVADVICTRHGARALDHRHALVDRTAHHSAGQAIVEIISIAAPAL